MFSNPIDKFLGLTEKDKKLISSEIFPQENVTKSLQKFAVSSIIITFNIGIRRS